MSRINFVLSWVEHGKSFYNLGAWSGSKLFDTLIVFVKEFFEKVYIENSQQMTTKAWKAPSKQDLEDLREHVCTFKAKYDIQIKIVL